MITARHDRRRKNPRIELYRRGTRIIRVFLQSGQLVNDRTRCPCDNADQEKLPIGECRDHGKTLCTLAIALYRWHSGERLFYRSLVAQGKRCCGSMDDCGLRIAELRITQRKQ
jgi:hypothetical protein